VKLKENTKAISFNLKDVFGVPITLESFKGKKVLLSFMRYTGCPVCNLHVHELHQRQDDISKKNLTVIFVFESSVETMLKYIENEKHPFRFISDPEQTFYNAYEVEKSWLKFIRWGLTLEGLRNGIKGFTKYHKYSSMKGSTNRVGAEFLIDDNGMIERVHYGERVGDHMPLAYYL
jgi:peroxiredoxin